ncbi:MAG: acyl carrier protein [Myxococcales bacterium]|nr:acyl carrier protein [Myxococcales bacterium]
MDIADKVRGFIKENFYADASDLTDEASLLDMGIVDSTGILELVMFLETEFDIKVEDQEILPENLDSIANTVEFVKQKQAS